MSSFQEEAKASFTVWLGDGAQLDGDAHDHCLYADLLLREGSAKMLADSLADDYDQRLSQALCQEGGPSIRLAPCPGVALGMSFRRPHGCLL